MTLPST